MTSIKGMPVNVYSHFKDYYFLNRITSQYNRLYIVGEDIPPIAEPQDPEQMLVIQKRGDYIYAVPAINPKGPWMFGGSFVYTSDSRFRQKINDYPIPVHDRVE